MPRPHLPLRACKVYRKLNEQLGRYHKGLGERRPLVASQGGFNISVIREVRAIIQL